MMKIDDKNVEMLERAINKCKNEEIKELFKRAIEEHYNG